MQGAWVRSLVGELSSMSQLKIPCATTKSQLSQKKKKKTWWLTPRHSGIRSGKVSRCPPLSPMGSAQVASPHSTPSLLPTVHLSWTYSVDQLPIILNWLPSLAARLLSCLIAEPGPSLSSSISITSQHFLSLIPTIWHWKQAPKSGGSFGWKFYWPGAMFLKYWIV